MKEYLKDLRPELPKEKPSAKEMKKKLRIWGIVPITWGIINYLLAKFLLATTSYPIEIKRDLMLSVLILSIFAVCIGLLTILTQRRGMFIVVGIWLLIFGALYIIRGALMFFAIGMFGMFIIFAIGAAMIVFGQSLIREFKDYASTEKSDEP